jgi:transposase-like protein
MDTFSEPHFKDDDAARRMIERVRWPNGPVCHHCGETERRYPTKREGRFRCGNPDCRQDYTVTTGSVMESSHIKLHKWLLAFYLMSSSKKGVSAHQLHRSLGITYKSAWFLAHRVREAMAAGGLAEPMGGAGQVVEVDEAYYGRVDTPRPRNKYLPPPTKRGRSGPGQKRAIVSLVEHGGRVRSFHPAVADGASVAKIVRENVAKESRLQTDESKLYTSIGRTFAAHETVNHGAKEYARGKGADLVTTNSVEGFFGIFKRGMVGVYQHCAEKHLHRYLAEYDFRYNYRMRLGFNDMDRTVAAVRGAEGKRLTYRQADGTGLSV